MPEAPTFTDVRVPAAVGSVRRRRIGIDLLLLSQFADTGMVTYAEQILPRLFEAMPDCDWILFARRSCPFKFDSARYPNARFVYSLWMKSDWMWKIGGVILAPLIEHVDLLFIPVSRAPLLKTCKLIIFVHDVGFLTMPEYLKAGTVRKTEIAMHQAERKADLCITNSLFTRQEFCQYYKTNQSKIDVTYLGYNDKVYTPAAVTAETIDDVMNRYGIRKPYVLYLGVIQGRKNLVRLIAAKRLWEKVHPELQLVLAGAKGWNCEEIYDAAARTPGVILTGRVDAKDLPVLYKNAECYVLPSVYEGFGMPVIEAMACGVPTVLSNRGALPEVGGDAAAFFNPDKEAEMAKTILDVVLSPQRREAMVKAGLQRASQFTWTRVAEATTRCFRKVLDEPGS